MVGVWCWDEEICMRGGGVGRLRSGYYRRGAGLG